MASNQSLWTPIQPQGLRWASSVTLAQTPEHSSSFHLPRSSRVPSAALSSNITGALTMSSSLPAIQALPATHRQTSRVSSSTTWTPPATRQDTSRLRSRSLSPGYPLAPPVNWNRPLDLCQSQILPPSLSLELRQQLSTPLSIFSQPVFPRVI